MFWHDTPAAVHAPFMQHGCPEPPHVPQLPAVQVPPTLGHVFPAPVQVFMSQHPPLSQAPFAQHGSPGAPHAAQTPMPPPPPRHTPPVTHVPLGQHAVPSAPQLPPSAPLDEPPEELLEEDDPPAVPPSPPPTPVDVPVDPPHAQTRAHTIPDHATCRFIPMTTSSAKEPLRNEFPDAPGIRRAVARPGGSPPAGAMFARQAWTMDTRRLLSQVREHAGLRTAREAERAVRATLGAIARALADDDALALSKALPDSLRRWLDPAEGRAIGTIDELYAESQRRERVEPGFAREHVQAVLGVLASELDAELLERIRKHLPPDIAELLRSGAPATEPPPYVHTHPARAPRPIQTLSRSRPGTAEPIAETKHALAQSGSVARSPAPHGERMVETARSTRPAREDETLATAREQARRR